MKTIHFYNKLIYDKIYKILERSTETSSSKITCTICNEKFNKKYVFKKIKFTDIDIHNFISHNFMNFDLYEQIALIDFKDYDINFYPFKTNSLNIIDGLYEEGSNKIYIENKKNIFNSKVERFSEHSGLIYFSNSKLEKIVILPDSRVDKGDPTIYLPHNSIETFKVDYIFHTHPKTPFIGSRVNYSIIYEFPSISDILHFVDHHNSGKLLGSIVIAPEGIYNIRKFKFSRDKIRIDYDIFTSDLEDLYIKCYEDSMSDYYDLIKNNREEINKEIKIPTNIFYRDIANNFKYIKEINYYLEKYDITIDFYNRVLLNNNWIFPTIYIPNL
jgi:hypothetical protein